MPGAACETAIDRPATTTAAERAAPVFVATVNETDPPPDPLVLDTVIHVGTPVTCQPHPDVVVTLSVPVVPAGAAETVPGDTVNVHDVPV